jgi:hypothetical protein
MRLALAFSGFLAAAVAAATSDAPRGTLLSTLTGRVDDAAAADRDDDEFADAGRRASPIMHLIAALGWVMCFYDLCYHRKPSDGAIWKRFCLTFPPVADYDAIAAAVATELRI